MLVRLKNNKSQLGEGVLLYFRTQHKTRLKLQKIHSLFERGCKEETIQDWEVSRQNTERESKKTKQTRLGEEGEKEIRLL